MTTLAQVQAIEAAIHRTVDRFYACDGAPMPHKQWRAYRAWIRARYDLLRKHHAAAINDCDQIIGKKWHYDNIGRRLPVIPPEHTGWSANGWSG